MSAATAPPGDMPQPAPIEVDDADVFVHLPAPLHAALRRRAQREGRTMAAVMRAGLCLYLERETPS